MRFVGNRAWNFRSIDGDEFGNCIDGETAMLSSTKRIGLITILLTALALGACAGAGQTTGEYVDDSVITSKVKARLFEDPATRGFGINVTTVDGVVYLTGLVDDRKEKNRAEELAQQTAGVKRVKNELTVK
jgi:hypothetical protein